MIRAIDKYTLLRGFLNKSLIPWAPAKGHLIEVLRGKAQLPLTSADLSKEVTSAT